MTVVAIGLIVLLLCLLIAVLFLPFFIPQQLTDKEMNDILEVGERESDEWVKENWPHFREK